MSKPTLAQARAEFATDPRGTADVDYRIADVEVLARWLDYAFTLPGGFRYGLAGFIGLIPGAGDVLDALLSIYIVARAVHLGIPRITIARMLLNVGIEALIGSVPLLGAVFDTVFKANRRNYLLLRNQLHGDRRQTANDWLFLMAVVLVALAGIALPAILLIEIVRYLG